MKISIKYLFVSLAMIFMGSALKAEPYLRIVQPFEGYSLPPVESSFVFGSVKPATATVTVNGVPVKPHTNGGFLVMIPFNEGRFEITAVASDDHSTSTVTRTVYVQEAQKTKSEKFGKIFPVSPSHRVVLRPGDIIPVSFQGAPGGSAYFKITGRSSTFPMYEAPGPIGGIYKGVYKIQPTDKFDGSDVIYYLKRKDGKKISQKARTKIIVQRRTMPRYIETTKETVLLTGPSSNYGYHMFLPTGVRLEVTGEWGEYNRVELSEKKKGWIRKSVSRALPSGTTPAISVSRNVRIDVVENSTIFELPLTHKHPFLVEQQTNPHRLRLTLYGVIPDTDRIRYKSRKTVIQEVTWTQNEPETVTYDIRTKQKHPWGYEVRYEEGMFVLELRHKPNLTGGNRRPLRGLRVALDAGHTKNNFGTIGPWAHTEFEVNVKSAKSIKRRLERQGAKVIMIQDGTREMSLTDRMEMAWQNKAHVFISIHADATGEGNDPRENEGFSVHYYHPQSRLLAEKVHALYDKNMGIRDQGLWRSNLAVCRMTHMPSILLEQAYLILPEFEELLLSAKFQRDLASTVVSSLSQYIGLVR